MELLQSNGQMKIILDGQDYEIDEQYRRDFVNALEWAVKHPNPLMANAQENINRAREKTGTQLNFGYPEFE